MIRTLRDDVRALREAADGLIVGCAPPSWAWGGWGTSEGAQLAWLIAILWRKYYEAAMARIALEARVRGLEDEVSGLRDTNERLTDLIDRDIP